jgi:hypothetical protein
MKMSNLIDWLVLLSSFLCEIQIVQWLEKFCVWLYALVY